MSGRQVGGGDGGEGGEVFEGFFDGSGSMAGNKGGAGWFIRRVFGPARWEVVAAETVHLEQLSAGERQVSSNMAEYEGFVRLLGLALRLITDVRVVKFSVYGDSQLVINQNLRKADGRAFVYEVRCDALKPVQAKAQRLMAQFPPGVLQVEWVSRSRNRLADVLARGGKDTEGGPVSVQRLGELWPTQWVRGGGGELNERVLELRARGPAGMAFSSLQLTDPPRGVGLGGVRRRQARSAESCLRGVGDLDEGVGRSGDGHDVRQAGGAGCAGGGMGGRARGAGLPSEGGHARVAGHPSEGGHARGAGHSGDGRLAGGVGQPTGGVGGPTRGVGQARGAGHPSEGGHARGHSGDGRLAGGVGQPTGGGGQAVVGVGQGSGGVQTGSVGRMGRAVVGARGEYLADWGDEDVVEWPVPVERGGEVFPEGREAIRMIPVEQWCGSVFMHLGSVPRHLAEAWAGVLSRVLGWWLQADGKGGQEVALMWLGAVHSMLLRTPRRGGVQGQRMVNRRFEAWREGHYGLLVKWWLADREAVRDFVPAREKDGSDGVNSMAVKASLARKVESLVAVGEVSRAVRLVQSKGVGDARDPRVVEQMRVKHPSRPAVAFPGLAEFGELPRCLFAGLGAVLGSLPRKAATGPSGFRNEYLRVLVGQEFRDGEARMVVDRLTEFGEAWVNAELPPWWYQLMSGVQCVPLVKSWPEGDGAVPDCRPIAVGEVWARVVHKVVAGASKEQAAEFLAPRQVAVGVSGGGSKLVFGMRLMLEQHPHWGLAKLDLKNAFNEVDRVKVLRALAAIPELRRLVRVLWVSLRPCSEVFFYGVAAGNRVRAPFRSEWGLKQGDPLSCIGLCVVLHEALSKLDAFVGAHGGVARGNMDDVLVCAPVGVLAEAAAGYVEDVERCTGARVSPSKSGVLVLGDGGGEVGLSWLKPCSVEWGVDGERAVGLEVLGVPVGERRFVQEMLSRRVDGIVSEISRAAGLLLSNHAQTLWCLLYFSYSAQFQYWLQHIGGEEVVGPAQRVDEALLGAVSGLVGGCGIDVLTRRRIELPASLGGIGLRSMVSLAPAAFAATVMQVVPSFPVNPEGGVVSSGFFPQLEGIVGTDLVNARRQDRRWEVFLESGCTTARWFREAWEGMREEIRADDNEQGETRVLDRVVMQAGRGMARKGLQRLITRQRESVARGRLMQLVRALDKDDPRRLSLLNVDQLSWVWVSCFPDRRGWLSTAEFAEVMTTYLGLPSPVCRGVVGQFIGNSRRVRIDAAGYALTTAHVDGDGWRKQHDGIKFVLSEVAEWMHVPVEVEVYGLFAGCLAQLPEGSALWNGRRLQGMIPDLCVAWDDKERLYDVKTLHCGSSNYWVSANPVRRPVEAREVRVADDCVKDARALDRRVHSLPLGEQGAVEVMLRSYGNVQGLVFGAFGEGSEGVHDLIELLAEVGCRRRSACGEGLGELGGGRGGEKGGLVWMLRHTVGMVAWRELARLKLHRLRYVGVHGVAAVARRRVQRAAREVRRSERRVWQCWAEWRRGRELVFRREGGRVWGGAPSGLL